MPRTGGARSVSVHMQAVARIRWDPKPPPRRNIASELSFVNFQNVRAITDPSGSTTCRPATGAPVRGRRLKRRSEVKQHIALRRLRSPQSNVLLPSARSANRPIMRARAIQSTRGNFVGGLLLVGTARARPACGYWPWQSREDDARQPRRGRGCISAALSTRYRCCADASSGPKQAPACGETCLS